jgi:hypothetical protein
MRNPDELLLDDELDDEPDVLELPALKRELAHEHLDDELGLRALWEQPEGGLPERLSRVPAAALRRMYAWNSLSEGDVVSTA